jgi:hypothetical protein
MPVLKCFGEDCTRFISVTMIPGGNPIALADPEKWATIYFRCASCGKAYCDRCVKKLSKTRCPSCGGELQRCS